MRSGRSDYSFSQLGLAVAQLAVMLLAGRGDGLRVAVDDSVFRRACRKVHGAGWQHDGSSPGMNKLSYGNCFVTAAILVRLPFCSREVGLPVLARLHLPGQDAGPSKVETAAALARLADHRPPSHGADHTRGAFRERYGSRQPR